MSQDYPSFNAVFYSLDIFVPLINLHQVDYWLPNANRWCDSLIGATTVGPIPGGLLLYTYLLTHKAIGWLLSTLLVAGLAGAIRN